MPGFRSRSDPDNDLLPAPAGSPDDSAHLSVYSFKLAGVEDLREAVYGSDRTSASCNWHPAPSVAI